MEPPDLGQAEQMSQLNILTNLLSLVTHYQHPVAATTLPSTPTIGSSPEATASATQSKDVMLFTFNVFRLQTHTLVVIRQP